VTGGKPIAARSKTISGVYAINPLVAVYDIRGRKRVVLFFYFVPATCTIVGKSSGIYPVAHTTMSIYLGNKKIYKLPSSPKKKNKLNTNQISYR
jgi:hypothetical protein